MCFSERTRVRNYQFPIGSIENYYFLELTAEINNEPRDEDYDYFFKVDGLPAGLDYYFESQTISIEGIPELTGTFDISVVVTVDGPFRPIVNEEPEILCNYSTSKTYTLIVE